MISIRIVNTLSTRGEILESNLKKYKLFINIQRTRKASQILDVFSYNPSKKRSQQTRKLKMMIIISSIVHPLLRLDFPKYQVYLKNIKNN